MLPVEGVGGYRSLKDSGGDNSFWIPFSGELSKIKGDKGTFQCNSVARGSNMDYKGDSTLGDIRGGGIGSNRGSMPIKNSICEQDSTGSKERAKIVPFGNQFKTSKCSQPNKILQIRGSKCSNKADQTGVVDVHIRSQRGLLSCGYTSKFSAISGIPLDGKLVQIQGSAIWPQPLSMGIHESSERDGQILEEKRNNSNSLSGRFSGNDSFQKRSFKSSDGSGTGLEKTRLDKRTVQRNMGTNTVCGISGFNLKLSNRTIGSTRREDSDTNNQDFKFIKSQESLCQNGSQCCRDCPEYCQSIFTSKTLYPQFLQSFEGFSKEVLGMGRGSNYQCSAKKGFKMDSETFKKFQWQSDVEACHYKNIGIRCLSDRLGIQIRNNEGGKPLDQGRKSAAHQRIGTASNFKRVGNSADFNSRNVSNFENRQLNSHEQLEQWRGEKRQIDSQSERDLEMVNQVECQHIGSSLDSWKGKYNPRLRESNDRLARLDFEARKISRIGEDVGSSHCGQNGIEFEPQIRPIQLNSLVSRNRSSELLLSELAARKQLHSATTQFDSPSSSTYQRMPGRSNHHSTSLGGTTLVAKNNEYDKRENHLEFVSTRDFQPGTFRIGGILESTRVEVPGSSNQREKWRKAVTELQKGARAPSTLKIYAKHWENFCLWCQKFKYSLPADVQTILDWMGWAEELELLSQVSGMMASISLEHKRRNWIDPTGNFQILEAKKGVDKFLARKRSDREERLPFPIEAFVKFRKEKPSKDLQSMWRRNSAIIVVGFRAMRRANEISNFRRKDFVKRNGMWFVRVSSQKNDQLAAGAEIPIESSGNPWTDPVKILDEFFEGEKFQTQDLVFQNAKEKDKPLSTNAISQIVKKMALEAGFQGRFSSHSLRIGGATAAMMGGMSLEQIMSIGNWKSAAVNMYLRALGSAKAGASKKMGF